MKSVTTVALNNNPITILNTILCLVVESIFPIRWPKAAQVPTPKKQTTKEIIQNANK